MKSTHLGCAVFLLLAAVLPAHALEPAEIVVVVNKNVAASQEVADHYCRLRSVPRDNLVVLDLPSGEDISRQDYNDRLAEPLRKALKDRRDKIKVLLCVYGVPLRVARPELSADDKAELEKLQPDLQRLEEQDRKLGEEIKALEAKKEDADKDKLADQRKERDQIQKRLANLRHQRHRLAMTDQQDATACVDSELSLLWWGDYELRGWQLNTLNFQVPEKVRKQKPPVVMVSRLDGPTPALAKRLVDQALETEKKGLSGKVYVDARGIGYDPKGDTGFGYGGYDESLREMARLLEGPARLSVTLDDKSELFAPGSCPECALYCGWYSLGKYVPCCRFQPGAVAYHIASSEAVSLRDPKCTLWCKCLLEDGVAATLGPVAEPYTIGFPKPAEFFGFLVTGKYTLVECYYRTLLLNSWMTVLVGDPLYNPYAKTPCLDIDKVKPSPRGGRFLLGDD